MPGLYNDNWFNWGVNWDPSHGQPGQPATVVAPTFNPAGGSNNNAAGEVKNQFGPDALMSGANAMWKQIYQSPFMRSQIGSILMGQNAGMGALAGQQGRSGMGQTGLGQAQGTMQRSAGAFQQSQAMGSAFQQALSAAGQNLGLQAGILPEWDRIQNPSKYRPWELGQQAFQNQYSLNQQNFLNDQQLMKLQKELQKHGWSWGDFLSAFSGVIPGLGGLVGGGSNSGGSSGVI